jgi:5-methylcytosine-specific restriction protein B
MPLHEKLVQELTKRHKEVDADGNLASRQQLEQYYAAFRERFGPDVLSRLDGEELLETMHGSGKQDTLIYWLEFKNDEEFPAIFGSIAGGSALKFGIYCRKDTGAWMTGSPQNQQELTVEEAILIARRHREQLIHGCKLLEELPAQGSDEDYRRLQVQMDREAPDVSPTAWGHKYFSLLYPQKLDFFHVEYYQRFHLIKLLQLPPSGNGRYIAAGRYVSIAAELNMPVKHLTDILNERDGRPHRYWRIQANFPDQAGVERNWNAMLNGRYVAIGWPNLGDLSHIEHTKESKDLVQALMKDRYGDQSSRANEAFNFVATMQEGDVVLAFEGSTVLGTGRIEGPYVYDPSIQQIPHRHPVEWLSDEQWQLPEPEAEGRTVREIRNPINWIEVERRILTAPYISTDGSNHEPPGIPRLTGIPGRIQSVLERKKQVILYGPPGTGKTYWARKTALELAAHAVFGQPFEQLNDNQKQQLIAEDSAIGTRVQMCTFHPAYGYEDFLEGYRPFTINEQLVFKPKDGIFKKICQKARRKPDQRFYLIIDEINRGDIPRIFGELLTVLEADKRNTHITLPLSGEQFIVPGNVYVIGTMNTADRSIALLDTALRRRFGFIELMPDSSVLGKTLVGGIPLGAWLDALNERLLENIGRDARNLQVGHAYFLDNGRPVADFSKFARIVQDDILPLLEEYCYEDYATLAKILGGGLVDEKHQIIHHELFEPAKQDDLVQALLEPSPEIVASPQVAEVEAEQIEDEENGDNLEFEDSTDEEPKL